MTELETGYEQFLAPGSQDDPEAVEQAINVWLFFPDVPTESLEENPPFEWEAVLKASRTGAYLDHDTLMAVLDKNLSHLQKNSVIKALADLEQWHDNSLYHLCMSEELIRILKRNRVFKLSELRQRLNDDELLLGKVTNQKILTALEEFDQLLSQSSTN